jgi:hypothetical protein
MLIDDFNTSILEEYIILDLTWQTCDEKMHVYLPTWNVQITIRQVCNSPIYKILTTIHVNVQFYVWYRKLVRINVGENWMGNQEWTIETPTTRHRIRQTKQQQQTLTTPAVLHIYQVGKYTCIFSSHVCHVRSSMIYSSKILVMSLRRVQFEDTKGVIRIRKSKENRQHNGQNKKVKRTKNDLQNIHIKLKTE